MIRAYALVSYLLFLLTLAYVIGWLADALVPRGIGDGERGSIPTAVTVDLVLLGVFAVQHSVMARPWFKQITARVVPRPAERATNVLASSLAVVLILWQWRPLDGVVWRVHAVPGRGALWILYAVGWLVVVLSTFMIGHLDMFGLRQAVPGDRYAEPRFGRPGLSRPPESGPLPTTTRSQCDRQLHGEPGRADR